VNVDKTSQGAAFTAISLPHFNDLHILTAGDLFAPLPGASRDKKSTARSRNLPLQLTDFIEELTGAQK